MINIEPKYFEMIQDILKHYVSDYDVWLFGSRTSQEIKPFSDVDLVIMSHEDIPVSLMAKLTLAFEESELPYQVDIVEWHVLDEGVKKNIQAQHEPIQSRTCS